MIFLRLDRGYEPGPYTSATPFVLVDSEKESGAHVPLVVARGTLVVDERVQQGGHVNVSLRFDGESTVGR